MAHHPEKGLTAEEFSKSIVSYLRPELLPKYLKHIDKLGLKGTITLNEYITFQNGIVSKYEDIADKLSEKGVRTYKKFVGFFDAYSNISKTKLPSHAISILFKILDIDSKSLQKIFEFILLKCIVQSSISL